MFFFLKSKKYQNAADFICRPHVLYMKMEISIRVFQLLFAKNSPRIEVAPDVEVLISIYSYILHSNVPPNQTMHGHSQYVFNQYQNVNEF